MHGATEECRACKRPCLPKAAPKHSGHDVGACRLSKLVWAENELKRIRDHITRDIAPGSARKIRSALKSVQGAIRNAERFSRPESSGTSGRVAGGKTNEWTNTRS